MRRRMGTSCMAALLVALSLSAAADHGGHWHGHGGGERWGGGWGGGWGGWGGGWGEHWGGGWGGWGHGWVRGYGYGDGMWHGGRWFHGDHDGRFGWWWIVGPSWMMYNQPFYPYPDPMLPPTYIIDETVPVYSQPLVQAQPQQVPPPPPAQVWYHCRHPDGYYPYVSACPSGWQTVPAVPSDARRPR